MSRANGWYFVRIDDEWRPAEWFDGDWDLSPMMALLILEVDEDPISIAIHAENRQLRAKATELEAQSAIGRRALAELLEQAAEDIQEWGAYASAYFQEKHNLAANVAKYREAARRLLAGGE